MKKFYAFVFSLFLFLSASAQTTIYVDSSRPAMGNGASWNTAYKELRDAITAANGQTGAVQILVSKGTYKPTATINRDTSFALLRDGLKLIGGYASGGGVRNAALYPTVLSGDIGTANDTTDNSYHILVIAGIALYADSLVVDGFTITGGNANGNALKTYNYQSIYNSQGGGIAMQNGGGSKVSLRNCTLTGNSAGNEGGGMSIVSSSPAITNFTLTGNSAGDGGGGMYMIFSSPTITNCILSGNSAERGAGMFIYNDSPTITNCILTGDSAHFDGGAMCITNSSPTITNCTLTGNSASNGGGMFLDHSSPTITNCVLTGNSAGNQGGGMYMFSSSPTITNCTLTSNSAAVGGAMFLTNSSPTITNCIIWANTAPSGVSIYLQSSTPVVTYSIVQGGYSGTGNLDTDPKFVNPADQDGADNIYGTADDGLRLQTSSPAINTGNTAAVPPGITTDITGAARIQGNAVDIGAYELIITPFTKLYVDSGAIPGGTGASWTTAFRELQDALAVAAANPTVDSILVAQGTYKPTPDANRDSAFVLSRGGLKLYGGYPAGGGVPNTTLNPTILSGDIGTINDKTDNSYHVVVIAGISGSADSLVVDGFTITGGNANGNALKTYNDQSIYNSQGGGIAMRNGGGSKVSLRNCTLTGNSAEFGGGMLVNNSSPTITNCTITGNSAIRGGGMYIVSSSPAITNCTLTNNNANEGGGMYMFSSSPTITNCTLSGNSANSGGAMFITTSSPTITNCTLTNNNAGDYGGGMFIRNRSSPTITNCIIWANSAPSGTSLQVSASMPVVTYSIVQDGFTGTGNLDRDPLFVDAASGNLRLQPCSPAINRGLNAANNQPTDIAGNNRIQVAIIDLGAYESPYDTIPAPRVTINANPGSTICAGTPVTFTATAVNGGSAPAYQWQKNRTIVSTDSMYTTSALSNRDTITVTLTNATSCSYPLAAADTLIVTVNPVPAKPTITANGPTTFCPGGSVMLTAPASAAYLWSNGANTQSITINQSGSYSVVVKNSNGCSSPVSDTTTVRAADNEKPVITCPAAQQFCYSSTGNYTTPALQASDNCSIQSTSYSITGATQRSGTGNNASGTFAPGTSTITWTVKDASNNMSTCTTTVKVNSQILVTIADSKALNSNGVAVNTVYVGYAPASSITLTANASGGSGNYTYQWSNGKTTQSITVSPTATTIYSVTVKDGSNCTGMANKTINVVDVRCGNKMDKVSVCHNGNTLCISDNAVDAHLNHGDYLGACGSGAMASRTTTTTSSINSTEETVVAPLATILYPNPNKGQFSIQLNSSKAAKADVQVLNAQGIVVSRKTVQTGGKSQTVPFSLNNPAAGTYLVKIVGEEGVQVLKMIVQP